MTRIEINNEVDSLYFKYNNILLTWATGCGKSQAAIRKIKTLQDGSNILICVAEIAHIKNWQREFQRWGVPAGINIKIICYASIVKYKDTNWDLIILDECHHIATDIRIDALKDIHANCVIALSATVSKDTKDALQYLYGYFYEFKISMQDAINWNILPTPKIYLVPLQLDNSKADQTYTVKWGKAGLRKKITCSMQKRWDYMKDKQTYPNVELNVKCTEAEKYALLTERFEFNKKRYMMTNNEAVKNMWMMSGSERKRFLGETKTRFAKQIIDKYLNGYRHIVFCTDILQADILGGKNAIHSGVGWAQTKIAEFNMGKTNSIYAVNMLQEGVNLANIEKGMIIQLDGVERAFIQKFGRTLRAEEPEIYVLYFMGTRDEDYLNNALYGINKDYITTLKI